MRRPDQRPTFANVTSLLALVVALGGTAYAAGLIDGADVKNSSLTGKDVKNKSLTGKDVKDKTLGGEDLRAGSVGRLELGDAAVGSAQVADGALTAGDLAPGTIPEAVRPGATVPTGATLRGVFNEYLQQVGVGTNGIGESVSFGGYQLAARPTIHVIGEGDPSTANCPGSVSSPEALTGQLCIYMTEEPSDAGAVVTITDPASPQAGIFWTPATELTTPINGDPKASRFGFGISPFDSVSNSTSMWGTWAVTG